MTQTNDPPLISSIELIPDAAEKADLDAANTSGGKLVIGQAPNITITQTTVVADADERLALDVQEGDIAIQTNVNTSFIFTGGDNVANNWQTIDFDAVGAIDGENINPRDITPRDITASGDISLQDLTVAGAINGADTSAAAAGEALTSDGSGSFAFASVGGDALSQMSDFLSQSNMAQIAASQSDMQDVIDTGLIQNVALSQTAMQEVGNSATAQTEVINSDTALNVMQIISQSINFSSSRNVSSDARLTVSETNENYPVFISSAAYTGYDDSFVSNYGFYDSNNNFLGETIENEFISTLKVGWDSETSTNSFEPCTADIEAVIF